jgi:YHS domain-containing protein
MTKLTKLAALAVGIAYLSAPLTALAADKKDEKAKPYPLDTCIVSDEKLGEMGEPFAFVHKGQEIKLCCKPCQKDFNKNPEKYLKKIEKADKKK